MELDIVNVFKDEEQSFFIKNLNGKVLESGIIMLNWDWPEVHSDMDGVYIFEIKDESEDLETLVERFNEMETPPIYIPRKAFGGEKFKWREAMKEKKLQLKLFPVKTNKYKAIIYRQTSGNCTQVFYKPVSLKRKVLYRHINFKTKIATFEFEKKMLFLLNELPIDCLLFCKYNKKTMVPICYYPVNLEVLCNSSYEIAIESSCNIDLICNDKYNGAIVVKDF